MEEKSIREVVDRYFGAIQAMDMEAWLSCFAEDVVSRTPVGGPPVKGRDGMRLFLKQIIMTMKSVEARVDSVFVSGDGAAAKWSVDAMGRNGKPVFFEGITVFEMNFEGTIRRIWAYWNPAAVFATLNEPKAG